MLLLQLKGCSYFELFSFTTFVSTQIDTLKIKNSHVLIKILKYFFISLLYAEKVFIGQCIFAFYGLLSRLESGGFQLAVIFFPALTPDSTQMACRKICSLASPPLKYEISKYRCHKTAAARRFAKLSAINNFQAGGRRQTRPQNYMPLFSLEIKAMHPNADSGALEISSQPHSRCSPY